MYTYVTRMLTNVQLIFSGLNFIKVNHYIQKKIFFELFINSASHGLLPGLLLHGYKRNPSGVCIVLSFALSLIFFIFSLNTLYVCHGWTLVVFSILFHFPDMFCSPQMQFLVWLHNPLWPLVFCQHYHRLWDSYTAFIIFAANSFIRWITFSFLPMGSGCSTPCLL